MHGLTFDFMKTNKLESIACTLNSISQFDKVSYVLIVLHKLD